MFTKRIIPCLDVHEGRVVKGVNFVNLRDAGDPVEIAAAYDKAGADEVVFLDITASSDARHTVVDMVRRVAEKVFIPFTVGGGIRTVEDFRAILREGADKVSKETVKQIADAMEQMAAVKTGALIVVEQEVGLGEYEQTGIAVDGIVTSQLLINIFEKNTPLHDGAVIIRDNRIVSATCYLPLSDNMNISKAMGTRHRAALGLSEVSDAKIFVVSEETGAMSMAQGGKITREIDHDFILNQFQYKEGQEKKTSVLRRKIRLRKGKGGKKK